MANVEQAATVHPSPPQIADMYERWTLDCIIEVVQAIAVDLVDRPRQYREVGYESSTILQNLWFHTGTDPSFPNQMQRSRIFVAMLGPSDGKGTDEYGDGVEVGTDIATEGASQFQMVSGKLRETAHAWVNRQATQGEGQLLQAFLDEAITLQSYLQTLDDENNVVQFGKAQTQCIFNYAAEVLRDSRVAGVFGRPPAPKETWPLGSTFDGNGARLIEEITKAFPTKLPPLSQSKFTVIQRIASFGARTIAGVLLGDLSPNPDEPLASRIKRLEPMIQATYSWKTALDHLAMSR